MYVLIYYYDVKTGDMIGSEVVNKDEQILIPRAGELIQIRPDHDYARGPEYRVVDVQYSRALRVFRGTINIYLKDALDPKDIQNLVGAKLQDAMTQIYSRFPNYRTIAVPVGDNIPEGGMQKPYSIVWHALGLVVKIDTEV